MSNKVYNYKMIDRIMSMCGLSQDITAIIYQYYLTYERRKNLMKPMKTYPLKTHLDIMYEHRGLNGYICEYEIYDRNVPSFSERRTSLIELHNEYGVLKNTDENKDCRPSRNILKLQNTYNKDYDKRKEYCLMCMDELYEQDENYCENPNCFFGLGQCGKMCGDCVEYDEHSYAREAINFYTKDLQVSHCGKNECEDYLEDKLNIIENGLVCIQCDEVLLPEDFEEYPFDNDEGHIYRKRCDGCYEELQVTCLEYWDTIKFGIFKMKIYTKESFWKDYIPDDSDSD